MATFKKPRRNFRSRKIVTEDESDEEKETDIQEMEVDDQANGQNEAPKPHKKQKKSKKEKKASSLSFVHDEHDEGLYKSDMLLIVLRA
jgi:hypothetical protein